ncbi:MAG: Y-family DNA polymerase [Proteobacteria bacterium]|nr:Y-family DNA polymerase [Pseudomonadota bacterium]
MKRAIALVDCNNFYVSCERLFRPDLEGKPVVILSNNDGCVVSRSQEVRDLGIMMAAPWFKLKDLAKKHGIIALSSNYALYADLSNRVMRLLAQYAPNQEIYSIDECFLDMTGMTELTRHGQQMRHTVRQYVGIPVCVGIASTKTLAKLANHVAKKQPHFNGVCNFNDLPVDELNTLLEKIEVGEVWGVGRRTTLRLQQMGITTVLNLKNSPASRIRAEFGVVLARTLSELGGTVCLELDELSSPRQQIICSRSFGASVVQLSELEQAVIAYTTRAAEKLRQSHSLATCVQVSIRTSPHQARQYQPDMNIPLAEPTDDTRVLCHAALSGLRQIYRSGYTYQKAGVTLSGIIAASDRPRTLFDDVAAPSAALMATIDGINRRMGSGTIRLLGEGIKKNWAMKRGNRSPRYTTELTELAVAKA